MIFPVVDVVYSFRPSNSDFPSWDNAKMSRLTTCDCEVFPVPE